MTLIFVKEPIVTAADMTSIVNQGLHVPKRATVSLTAVLSGDG